jgi:HEAT repeat protein
VTDGAAPTPPNPHFATGGRVRRRFGPLFYVTAAIALVVAGSRPFWESASEQYTAWRLTRQLRDSTKAIREHAALELARLGPAATSWVIRATRDRDPVVRELACSIVVQTTPERPDEALAALLVAAKDIDPALRERAVMQLERMIGRYGTSPETILVDRAIQALGEALGDDSRQVRLGAILGILTAGPKARSVLGSLDRMLGDPDKAIRIWAADAMLHVDADSTRTRVIAAMSPMLKDLPMRLEHFKVVAILTSAQGAEATAAMLVPLLKDADRETRLTAMYDLTTHCSSAKAVRPAMIEALKSDDLGMRQEAAVFFLAHEPGMTGRVIDALVEQIAIPAEGSYCGWALVTRLRVASWSSVKPLTPKLLELLGRSTKPATRAFLFTALGEIGREALAAVAVLLELSNDKDLELATSAVAALVKIDPRIAATRIPSLLEWTTTGHDSSIRLRAIASLRDLGPAAAAAMPGLLKLADEQDLAISEGAIEAISKIDPPTGQTLKQAIVRSDVGLDDE